MFSSCRGDGWRSIFGGRMSVETSRTLGLVRRCGPATRSSFLFVVCGRLICAESACQAVEDFQEANRPPPPRHDHGRWMVETSSLSSQVASKACYGHVLLSAVLGRPILTPSLPQQNHIAYRRPSTPDADYSLADGTA